jgi:type I restriction enzyme R subunit
MWEDILTRDTVLYLLDSFIFIQREVKKDSGTGKKKINFLKPEKSGEVTKPEWAADPEIEYPVPGGAFTGPDERKLLSKIIEELNALYNKHLNTDFITQSALQIKDILMKDERLKASAKTNTFTDFHFTYNDSVDDALVDGYDQNEEFYSLLLNNDEIKKRVMYVFIEGIYKSLREADGF